MKKSEFTTVIITADEGMYLTQSADVAISERIICTEVALGCNSSPGEWKEITKEEGDEYKSQIESYRKEREQQRQAEMKAMMAKRFSTNSETDSRIEP